MAGILLRSSNENDRVRKPKIRPPAPAGQTKPKKQHKMKKLLTIIGLAAASSLTGAQAAILIQDNFPTNGALVGTTPATGGIWQTLSGTAGSLGVSGNALQIVSANTQDAESDFAASQSITLYSSFTLNMSATLPTTGGEYFASYRDGAGYDGRIFALRPTGTAAGKFRLGISNEATASFINWASDLDTGTNYQILTRFTQGVGASDFITLWVNPTDISSTSISTDAADLGASLTAFAFRQAGNSGNSAVDNLVVATTFAEVIPEPTTWALIGLGSAFALSRIRRRSNA